MRSMRQRLAAVTLLGGLTTLGLGVAAGPASAASVQIGCPPYLGAAQSGSLHLSATPAGGSTAPAGSDLSLAASWDENDFDETNRLYLCATVDNALSSGMSSFHLNLDNDGALDLSTTIPANTPVGSTVCVLAAVEGRLIGPPQYQGNMVSETICYTSSVVTTTTTMATTTTTTVAPRIVEPVVDPTGTEAGTNTAPAVEAAPVIEAEVAENPAPLPVLPRTGSGLDLLAGFGGVAIALGGLARFTGRKRSAEG
jgi:hypothetical protein